MKKIAIISRALMMNGATKALVEMLKRLPYDKYEIDLLVLDFSNIAQTLVDEIPKAVNIIPIAQYSKKVGKIFEQAALHPIHFVRAIFAGGKLKDAYPMITQWKYTAWRLPVMDKKYDVAISFRHFDIDVFYVKNNIIADKKIFWIHGVQPLSPFEIDVLKPIYESYDLVCPVSTTAKNNITKLFPDLKRKCRIAYCVVDGVSIQQKAKIGKRFCMENRKIILFTIGRLGTEKGIDFAVEVCFKLIQSGYNVKWYVAGDGDQRKNLEDMIQKYGLKDSFFLLGNVPNPYGYLDSCDIYVQTSLLESYCLAINEAKIIGKPIVSTNIPAAQEQLQESMTGILVDRDIDKFCNVLEKLIQDKQMRDEMTMRCKATDWSHFELIDQFDEFVN